MKIHIIYTKNAQNFIKLMKFKYNCRKFLNMLNLIQETDQKSIFVGALTLIEA